MQNNIKEIITECCYSKLFSALRIGPAFIKLFGFDLVIYEDSVEFALEKCKLIKDNTL